MAVDITGIFNASTVSSGIGAVAAVVIYVLLLLFLGAIAFAIYYYYVLYSQQVIIFSQIGKGAYEVNFTRGRTIKKKNEQGIDQLILFRNKEEVPPVSQTLYGIHKKKRCVIFSRVGGMLQPAKVTFPDTGEIAFQDEFIDRQLYVNADKQIKKDWDVQSFADKYGQAIILGGSMVIVIFVLLITFKYQQDVIGQLTSVASELSRILERAVTNPKPLG